MTWLVFAVSALLVLAGAASVISGAPIIQLERGWAEVIAGTVALSSGGVVFALAVVLLRLEALVGSFARESVVEDASVSRPLTSPADLAVSEESATGDPVEVEPDTSVAQPIEDERSETRQGLWKRVKRPEPSGTEASAFEREQADRTEVAAIPAPERSPGDPVREASSFVPVASVEVSSPEPLAEPAPQEKSLGWLERTLFRSPAPPKVSRPEEPRQTPAVETAMDPFNLDPGLRTEPAMHSPESTPVESDPIDTPDHHHHRDGNADDTAADAITVLGRYQAGTSSYVMYSDGTIEVETETGETHRFGSMDELKAYIAGQETGVS